MTEPTMQIIRDWTIRRKIGTGFALVLVVRSLQGWFAIRTLGAMSDSVGKIGCGELPPAAVSQLYRDSRVFILGLTVATVLAGLLLSLFLARLIAHPIEQLGIATERVSRGDLTVEIRSGSRRQRRAADVVVKAMENILEVAQDHLATVVEMSKSTASLAQQAENLAKLISAFRAK